MRGQIEEVFMIESISLIVNIIGCTLNALIIWQTVKAEKNKEVPYYLNIDKFIGNFFKYEERQQNIIIRYEPNKTSNNGSYSYAYLILIIVAAFLYQNHLTLIIWLTSIIGIIVTFITVFAMKTKYTLFPKISKIDILLLSTYFICFISLLYCNRTYNIHGSDVVELLLGISTGLGIFLVLLIFLFYPIRFTKNYLQGYITPLKRIEVINVFIASIFAFLVCTGTFVPILQSMQIEL